MGDHAAIADEDVHPFAGRLRFDAAQHRIPERLQTSVALRGHAAGRGVDAGGGEEVLEQVREQVAELEPPAVLGAGRVIVDARQCGARVGPLLRRGDEAAFAQMFHLQAADVVGEQATH